MSQDITDAAAMMVDSETVVKFTRPRLTMDSRDIALDQNPFILYAWGGGVMFNTPNTFSYHGANRGFTANRHYFPSGEICPGNQLFRLFVIIIILLIHVLPSWTSPTAENTADFELAQTTLVFPTDSVAGTRLNATITIIDDVMLEGTQSLNISIASVSPASNTYVHSPSSALVLINDNDGE